MNKLLAADTYLIETVQEAYLWLWDRTVVFVATLIFTCVVFENICYGLGRVAFIQLALMGVFSGYRYAAQQKDLRLPNSLALGWRTPWLRCFFYMVFALNVAISISEISIRSFCSDLFFLLWNCLACVQVRDREPKDFFASRKLAGAGA